jgi:hypothetical protein
MTDIEPIMAAAFAHLSASATIIFTASASLGEAELFDVSPTADLFAGLPVFGPGVPAGAMISAVDHDAATVTLTAPMEDAVLDGDFTTGFLTKSRRARHWQQTPNQPAFFLRRVGMTDEADGHFVIRTIECEMWIYCNAGQDEGLAADEALTGLETMLRRSLAPDQRDDEGTRFTLGGLVYWCRIEGRADISPGDQDAQAIARIPLRITIP